MKILNEEQKIVWDRLMNGISNDAAEQFELQFHPQPYPAVGDMWFSVNTRRIKIYNGTAWVQLGA